MTKTVLKILNKKSSHSKIIIKLCTAKTLRTVNVWQWKYVHYWSLTELFYHIRAEECYQIITWRISLMKTCILYVQDFGSLIRSLQYMPSSISQWKWSVVCAPVSHFTSRCPTLPLPVFIASVWCHLKVIQRIQRYEYTLCYKCGLLCTDNS